MGSSKKHKEKKDKSSKKKKRSRSPQEEGEKVKKSSKKIKEKRRHSDSEDSDAPLAKSSRLAKASEPSTSRARSPSPFAEGGEGDVLSIEATNKLRLKLGLKPLQIESSKPSGPPPPSKPKRELEEGENEEVEEDFDPETLARIREEREKEGETFWQEKAEFVHAPPENLGEVKKSEKIRDRIQAVREKRRIEEKLSGVRGLGDDDDEDLDDATKWVERSKRLAEQKALAEKREKALAELDDEFGIGDLIASEYRKTKSRAYSSKDLKGMKVLHAPDKFDADANLILTLKDKGVLDEEDDALVNVNMLDDEMHEKNRSNRNVRSDLHGYNVYDDAEFDEHGVPKEKSLLSKYDEDIDGAKKRKTFVIGENLTEEEKKAQIRVKMERANKILENVTSAGLKIASDFYTQDEMVQFKKPKKKIRKVRKTALRADDLLSINPDNSKESKQADHGSRKKKGGEPEIKKEMDGDEIKQEPMDMEIDLDIDDLPPQTYVDVSDVQLEDEGDLDFQRALNKARISKQRERVAKHSIEAIADAIKSENDDKHMHDFDQTGNVVLHATAEFCRTLGDLPNVEGDDIYGDEEMDFERDREQNRIKEERERGAWNEVEIDETPVDIINREDRGDYEEAPILEQEPDIGIGVAGALKLAMNKGYLDHEKKKPSAAKIMKHLEAQNYSIEDKNYEDERDQRSHSRRDMYSGPVSEFKEKSSYKPNIKLDYVDEDGKTISSKEAFRILSHKFHGKGSGKNKIDKKRRKLEQEKLMKQMNSTDTPLGTMELLQQRQKDSHSAYVVLSGNKGHTSMSKSKH